MRIVAGEFRGRKLLTPKDSQIRPTSDKVREAIFNIIASRVPGASVLDLFAGTGALGLEALSRGAARAVFVDRSPEAIRLIRANVELCRARDRARIVQGAVSPVVQRLVSQEETFHLIFMDPPYGKGYIEETLLQLDKVEYAQALIVAEHHIKDLLPQRMGEWLRTQERRYGDTAISFFMKDLPR
jgi:16S rRNA (guanine(966)-N(2))-methyltransferase RsmD